MTRNLISKGIALPAYLIILVTYYTITTLNGFPEPDSNSEMLLYKFLIKPFFEYQWLNIATSALLVSSTALITSMFVNKYYLTGLRTHLPLFFNFMLLTAGGSFIQLTPGLFAIPIILFSLNSIFESYDKDYAVFHANTAAIGVSIAALLYLPFIFLLPILVIVLMIVKQFNLKNSLAAFTGTIVLPLILGGLFFYLDTWEAYISPIHLGPVENNFTPPNGYWLFLGVITIWTLIAYIMFIKQAPLKKIRARKIYNIINVLGIGCLIITSSGYASIANMAPIIVVMILVLVNHMYPLLNNRTRIIFLASTISTYLFSFVNTL